MQTFSIKYIFAADDGKTHEYELNLDKETLLLQQNHQKPPPQWTKLPYEKCDGCPLREKDCSHCPVAVNLANLVEEFKSESSVKEVEIRVVTSDREFVKKTAIQYGLFSIFGVIMATSGCPVMDFFRPMARFHLPFATMEETMVRSTAFYLLRQYFRKKNGNVPDFDLTTLDENYQNVARVNRGIINRIGHLISDGDADQNAIVILDSFAQMLAIEIQSNLGSLEYLFREIQSPEFHPPTH